MIKDYSDDEIRPLYHKDCYMPVDLIKDSQKLMDKEYLISRHLYDHLMNPDEKHFITSEGLEKAMDKVREEKVEPFEVETDFYGYVTKFVCRVPYDDEKDISIVYGCINKYGKPSYIIKTAWLNSKDDKHRTLDYSKYVKLK